MDNSSRISRRLGIPIALLAVLMDAGKVLEQTAPEVRSLYDRGVGKGEVGGKRGTGSRTIEAIGMLTPC